MLTSLEATKSYAARSARISCDCSKVTLRVQRGRQTEITGYDLEVEPSADGVVRTVYLAKHDQDGTIYQIDLSPDGTKAECSCPGHRRHHQCKHADAVVALLSAGKLPPTDTPPSSTSGYGPGDELADAMAEFEQPRDLGEDAAAMDAWADAVEIGLIELRQSASVLVAALIGCE